MWFAEQDEETQAAILGLAGNEAKIFVTSKMLGSIGWEKHVAKHLRH
jgi:hypothetical protein